MLRREVPVEQFELGFETGELKNPVLAKETFVTISRFLENEIAPVVKEVCLTYPTQNELDEHVSRRTQGDYFLGIQSTIEEFVEAQKLHVEQYLAKAMKGMQEPEDSDYVYEMAMAKLDSYLAPALDILGYIAQILSEHYEIQKGHRPTDDERTPFEDAVTRAGNHRSVDVDKLMSE